jgi:arylsulfatase A-like enzyme
VPPKGAPNVLLIMTDDAGYGVAGTFGGVIPTPALDRIASMGLRYTQFHSTALCSPTRAALITGRNHHSVGFGVIAELSTGYPGYDSVIGPENATIGEILKENGYATSWFGKNHNTPSYQTIAMIFMPFPRFVAPISAPPPLAITNVASMKHSSSSSAPLSRSSLATSVSTRRKISSRHQA